MNEKLFRLNWNTFVSMQCTIPMYVCMYVGMYNNNMNESVNSASVPATAVASFRCIALGLSLHMVTTGCGHEKYKGIHEVGQIVANFRN